MLKLRTTGSSRAGRFGAEASERFAFSHGVGGNQASAAELEIESELFSIRFENDQAAALRNSSAHELVAHFTAVLPGIILRAPAPRESWAISERIGTGYLVVARLSPARVAKKAAGALAFAVALSLPGVASAGERPRPRRGGSSGGVAASGLVGRLSLLTGEPSPRPEESPPGLSAPDDLEGFVSQRVSLSLVGGGDITGVLTAVSVDAVTISTDVGVATYHRSRVFAVRHLADHPTPSIRQGSRESSPSDVVATYPKKYGRGLIAGGGVLLGVGIAATITGIALLGYAPSAWYYWVPALAPGLAALGAGAPMVVKGRRRKALRGKPMAAVQRIRLAPVAAPTRWGAVLTLRF